MVPPEKNHYRKQSPGVKRETGATPVRTRHCKYGVKPSKKCHWEIPGKADGIMGMYEPGNLPHDRYRIKSGSRVTDRTVKNRGPCILCFVAHLLIPVFGMSFLI